METLLASIGYNYEIIVPVRFGKYEIVKMIGVGAFSVVALVKKIGTEEKFACKIYSRKFMMDNRYWALFERELRIFEFVSHPNIVKFEEVIYGKDLIFMIMELCRGGDLFEFINIHGRVEERLAKKMFRELLSSVKYLHGRDIAHRDLKPENILLTEDCSVRVSDFGFCEEIKGKELLTLNCGSEYYMAPEVSKGIPYDGKKSDIWSLGVILYSMTTGCLPWDLSSETKISEQAARGDFDIPESLDAGLRNLITQMMDPNPKYRPSCDDILKHPWLKVSYEDLQPARRYSMQMKKPTRLMSGKTINLNGKINDILRQPVLASKKGAKKGVNEAVISKPVMWTEISSQLIALRRQSVPITVSL